ncbi:MAG: hypothetical protein AAFY72_02050 [Cyanobacteria bacterium J06649_4]
MLWVTARVQSSPLMGGWATIFLMLLADDRLRLHERLGKLFVQWFGLSARFNLRDIDFGEIAAYLILGVSALAILVFSVRREPNLQRYRALSLQLFACLLGLVFFGAS